MASRQLRKLRKQQELLNLQNESAREEEEESEDEAPIVAKPRGNPFAGFAALADEGEDDDEGNKTDDDEEAEYKEQPSVEQLDGTVTTSQSKKPKKKNKKKKKKGKAPVAADADADGDTISDLLNSRVEQLKLENPGDKVEYPAAKIADLLRINFQHLKAINEMRRLFGKAMDVADADDHAQPRRMRNGHQEVDLETYLSAPPEQPGRQNKLKGLFDTVLRTNPFIEGKKTWPRNSTHGLKMARVSMLSGEYTFVHDKTYESLEATFFEMVQMHDPMQLVHFLRAYPYHVSTLIQVSKVAKQDQNAALAADLIERALFAFGRASLSEFRKLLEQGRACLSFKRPENRQFFLAGWNLVKHLKAKGTFRTALEWSKLLLSLDFVDPYGIINWLHPLAIHAHEAQWFVDFCATKIFEEGTPFIQTGAYIKQTLVLAHLQLKDTEAARAALLEGIHTVPWLYCSLFSALNLDAPRCVWGVKPRDENEDLYTELYIHVTKDLWQADAATQLLVSTAASAPRNEDIKSLPKSCPAVTLADARFVYLDDTPALMAHVPRHLIHDREPNFDFDPLPPAREDNTFSSYVQEMPWQVAENNQEDSARRLLLRRVHGNPQVGGAVAQDLADEMLDMAERELRLEGLDNEDGRRILQEGLDRFVTNGTDDAWTEQDGVVRRILDHILGGVRGIGMRAPFAATVEDAPDDDSDDDDADSDDMPDLIPPEEEEQQRDQMPGGWGNGRGWEE